MMLGKFDSYMQKNETRPPFCTTQKNKFKMDQRLKCQTHTIKIVEENIGSKILGIAYSNILLVVFLQERKTKEK